MDSTPPGEETPKDFATRRVDLEQPESASETAAQEAGKKSLTRKTPAQQSEAAVSIPAVTVPVEDRPVSPPPPPASMPELPAVPPRNERLWIAAIIGICLIVLACLCACTIVAVAFLSRPPW